MTIVSVKENPDYAKEAIQYFQKCWATNDDIKIKVIYEDCILSCLKSESPLPQWYLLYDDQKIIGCAGLITNDFISRMDLWPWLCALYIEEDYRGNAYGALLINRINIDTKKIGYNNLYLCTDHVGYYEKYGFEYIAQGYHPWGESSRIYESKL